jgi:hypothetical protein
MQRLDWEGLARDFGLCLGLFILSRCFFWIVAISVHTNLTSNAPDSALFALLDGYWYLDIALHGYDVHARGLHFFGQQNYVFFPLYPLLIKGFILCTGIQARIAAQCISNACFLAALYLFYRWMDQAYGTYTARISAILLAFSPYNIYFMAIYTDALFLLLFLLFWFAAQKKSWLGVGIYGFLLGLTHPNGVFILFFALWFAWDDYQVHAGNIWRYWPILLIPCSIVSFMVYLHFHVGDALAFLHNERQAWHRDGWHFAQLPKRLARQTQGDSYNLAMYGLALVFSVFLWLRGRCKEALVIPVFTVMALLSGTFVALARYSAALFPFYIALGLFAIEKKGFKMILAAEVVGSILLMYCWIEQAVPAF